MARVIRSLVFFGLAMLAYLGYATAVVPLIEPEVQVVRSAEGTNVTPGPRIEGLSKYFAADAWERDNPKVLETENGALLFRDYQPRDDGTIELKPVTLIYYPEGEDSADPPVLIQAPQGAILQSDRTINLARADFGRPIAGRLQGNITIRRPRSSPEQDDELYVATRNVQIDRQRIWTPNEVEFRLGPHWGRGRDLQIRFHENDARTALMRKQTGVVRELQLGQIEKVLIAIDDRTMSQSLLGRPAAEHRAEPASPGPPVELRCSGQFRFHFLEQTAVLSDDVTLTRKHPDGLLDSLRCELLEIHFAAPAPAAQDVAAPAAATPPPLAPTQLLVDRLLAKGQPVQFEFPSQRAFARAELIECFYAQRRIVLEGATGAWLKHGTDEMEAIRLDYTFHPDDPRRPGELTAEGAGRIMGGTAEQGRFAATWSESLQLRAHEGHQLLSMLGETRVVFEEFGEFSARQIHLFLHELPAGAEGSADGLGLAPDRLAAHGDVRIHSPWLKSSRASQELKVWFVPVATPPNSTVVAGGASAGPPAPPPAQPAPKKRQPRRPPNGPPLEFQGDVIEVRVLAGEQMALDDVTVAGQVLIVRPAADATGLPVKISGQLLQISGLSENQARVQVQGQPAEAMAEGVTLRGERIWCDQMANRMWIPGPGEMITPRDLRSSATAAPGSRAVPPLTITWSEGLEFDGTAAVFRGEIIARGLHLSPQGDLSEFRVRGQEMQAELTRRISFVDPPEAGQSLDVDLRSLSFRGEVLAENRTKAADGSAKSWEELKVVDLKIDKPANLLTAAGPGTLSSVRLSSGFKGLTPQPAGPLPPAPAQQPSLVHVQVRFAHSLTSHLLDREITLFGRVRATYAPVQNWEQRFDPERQALGPEGLELLSEELQLTEMPADDPRRPPHHEMLATGNVQVRGESFRATGHRLSYDDGKDLVILEGTGRDLAVIRSAWGNGNAEARVIKVWPKSKRVQSEGIRTLDFGPVSNQR